MTSFSTADRSKPYIPLSGESSDGYSNADEATATCFCGEVQLAFPIKEPGLIKGGKFLCHCTDCHKIHSSMFASNFCVVDKYLKHLRGEEKMTQYGIAKTTTTGNNMINFFCSKCGTLMYRRGTGFPGTSILRIGTVDDFTLMETVLKPDLEQFIEDKVSWLPPAEGIKQVHGFAYDAEARKALKELREKEGNL